MQPRRAFCAGWQRRSYSRRWPNSLAFLRRSVLVIARRYILATARLDTLGFAQKGTGKWTAQIALDLSAPPEEILRAVIRARIHSLFRGDRPDWNFRIMAHELAQPTPALRRLVNKAGQPLFHRLLGLIGGMIGLPAEDESTRLCAISLLGQIMVYALAGPLVTAIWPKFELTPDQVERIADHIADFSLSYIQNFRSETSTRSIKRTRPAVKPRASK